MKIGILETGRPPEQLQPQFGTYPAAFEKLLHDQGFEFASWAALEGDIPDSIHLADGWLITGSRFGAYEDHDWIPPLEAFLRDAYAASIPIVGICFGHQILAQALGGTVEKFSGGWSVGRVEYQLDISDEPVPLYAWHQDQVTQLPADATVVGSTDFCRYAALRYGDRALTVQPHPEFNADFIQSLLHARRDVLPADIAKDAVAGLADGPTQSPLVARWIGDFFRQSQATERPASG
jgi:GMP synthase (glutamine-hydrolysing)